MTSPSDDKTKASGAGPDPVTAADRDYFSAVEEHFGRRRGGPLVLSPKDWRLVRGWREREVPLKVVLRGINRAFDRFAMDPQRVDRINSLRYCEQHVEEVWEDYRAARAGAVRVSGDEGYSDAVRHLRRVAAKCRELGAGAASDKIEAPTAGVQAGGTGAHRPQGPTGRLQTGLVEAAEALETLATDAERGRADAAEVDRRANEAQRRLEKILSADAEADRRLAIPPFSPYAV